MKPLLKCITAIIFFPFVLFEAVWVSLRHKGEEATSEAVAEAIENETIMTKLYLKILKGEHNHG